MMTQSVMTQAANLIGSTSGSTTAKEKKSGKSDFNLFINSSMSTIAAGKSDSSPVQHNTVQKAGTKDSSDNDDKDIASVQSDNKQTKNVLKTDSTKTANQKAAVKTDETEVDDESVDKNITQTKDDTSNDAIVTQINNMLQQIKEAVMKALNLSSEEFDQLLSGQGMSAADLLQSQNLQQLILANNGQSDILSALTDENLADTIQQLLQSLENIKAENNIGLTNDQIKSLLEQVKAQMQTQTESTSKEQTTDKKEATQQKDSQNQAEIVNTTDTVKDNKDNLSTKPVSEKSVTVDAKPVTESGSHADLQSDTNSGAKNDLNTQPQFQTFVDNLVNASSNLQSDFSGQISKMAELRNIANQIIDKIKISVTSSQTSMELQLNPESLGKVNLTVQSKNGLLTARFVVQNEISREAIESQMQTLRETLTQQGIKVDAIEVTVSANAFEQNTNDSSDSQAEMQKNNSGKKITMEEAMNMTEAPEEEEVIKDATGLKGSMVDYTA